MIFSYNLLSFIVDHHHFPPLKSVKIPFPKSDGLTFIHITYYISKPKINSHSNHLAKFKK